MALVLGEDRFSVYLPEPQTFKLYMPLTADFYGRDEWGDMSEDGEEWDGHTLMDYEGQILSALVKTGYQRKTRAASCAGTVRTTV